MPQRFSDWGHIKDIAIIHINIDSRVYRHANSTNIDRHQVLASNITSHINRLRQSSLIVDLATSRVPPSQCVNVPICCVAVPDGGRFELSPGVIATFSSPNYPGDYTTGRHGCFR